MTDPTQILAEAKPVIEAVTRRKKLVRSQSAQTVTANMIFPLLLLIPGIREWVATNPEAYVSIQGVLNVLISAIREKLGK